MLEDSVFLAGNLEAQRLSNTLSEKYKYLFVRRHFIYSCLLSENVYFPAANFFQSPITERLTIEFAPLFRATDRYPQLVHIAINPSKENFYGEALEKSNTYPEAPAYIGYKDKVVRERMVAKLNEITTPFFRRGKLINSLNGYIRNETEEGGFLNIAVEKFVESKENTKQIFRPLQLAIEKNEMAIVPEYIMQFDSEGSINRVSEYLIRLSLLKAYTKSLEKHYGAYVNNPLIYTYQSNYLFPYQIHYLDTFLFDQFFSFFEDVYKEIIHISAEQLREVKYSERFRIFLDGYCEFVAFLSEKRVPFIELRQELVREKKRQDQRYSNTLQDLITDSKKASLLYRSIYGIKARMKRMMGIKILKTNALLDMDRRIFLYALADEISETFLNRYNVFLMETVKQSHQFYKKRRINTMFNFQKTNTNIGGTQIIVQDSKNTELAAQSLQPTGNSFEKIDFQQIELFADRLLNDEMLDLQKSMRVRLAASLYEIRENSSDVDQCISKARDFHNLLDTLGDISKKTIVSAAATILSKATLTFLGLE